MKPMTMAGMMAGSALGIALGAGIMMMPQTKNMRRAIQKGANSVGRSMANWMR